jgi:glutamate-5-semialdehyde dehydrogenase
MEELIMIGQKAKSASRIIANLSTEQKNNILEYSAKALIDNVAAIVAANELDLKAAIENGIKGAFIDRLTLTSARIESMALGLCDVAKLDDPVGEVLSMKKRPNGLVIGQKRVPMGVIGIIYEARPNVTADAFGLCLKAGSAVILRGGKEAINSNMAIIKLFQHVLEQQGLPKECVQLIEDTSRETSIAMMKMNKYIDILIPRGGAGLIQSVVNNSTVPVIETGVGNCHIFVDVSANQEKAVAITVNAKAQRPGVCNAAESLLIHKDIAEEFIPKVCNALQNMKVEIRGDEAVQSVYKCTPAVEEDWATEYADYIMAVKVVDSIDEAITHIQTYSTGHSEAIITEDYTNSQRFLNEIDSAAVYVNASTRFTDGYEFGFGAEIGISTQKLHARGPMGLKELTTTKYIVYGDGQIRK